MDKREVGLRTIPILVLVIGLMFCMPQTIYAAYRSKAINVVYDDSGSMAVNGKDSWSQAKYALEVFTAMLGPNDVLTIYPMTSFSYVGNSDEKSSTWGQTIVIKGSSPATSRIAQVSRMNGADGLYINTPIDSVKKAGDDLTRSECDDKWLVILTDGIFDYGKSEPHVPVDEAEKVILSYAGKNSVSCAYIAIGDSAHSMDSFSDIDGFYPYKAVDGEILKTVTEVARNVYNLQKVSSIGDTTISFSPDIPMSKILVFSQGETTNVGTLSVDGVGLDYTPDTVHVGIEKDDPVRPQNKGYNPTIADNLNGIVQTYTSADGAPFSAGEYSFTSNATTTDIYFEPGLDVITYLSDRDNNETIIGGEDCNTISGSWTVHIELVDPLTNRYMDVRSSPMLEGTVLSSLITDQSGKTGTYYDGDTLELTTGTYVVTSKAEFRGNVEKISPAVNLEVKDANLSVEFFEKNGYSLGLTSLSSDNAITFSVKDRTGELLTDEEYEAISFQEVTGPGGIDWGIIHAEDEKGVYTIHPVYKKETLDETENTGEIGQSGNLSIKVALSNGNTTRIGTADTSVEFKVDIGAVGNLNSQSNSVIISPDSVLKVESGEYKLSLSFFDGEKTVNDDMVPFAWAFEKSLILTDAEGKDTKYTNGDIIALKEGTYRARTTVSCIGTEENVGNTCEVIVGTGVIKIVFDNDEGYSFRMTDLSTEKEIAFYLTDSSGNPLTAEENSAVVFSNITGPSGVTWDTIVMDESTGVFHISPKFENVELGFETLLGKEEPLSLSASYSLNGIEKTGSGVTTINWKTGQVPVDLELVCPEPAIEGGKKKYMFDAKERGVERSAPFILVRASIKTGEESTRPLSETEWRQAKISISSSPNNQNILWRIISIVSRQTLDFKIVLGDEISTYKMYLTGLTTTGVRANESLLDTQIEIKLDNGIVEKGNANTVISVKPVGVFSYIGRFLIAISLIGLIIAFIIMEIRKNRFDRAMYPKVETALSKEGVPVKIPGAPFVSKKSIKYKVWPPLRAEERDVSFRCPGVMNYQINFTCKATGGGFFIIKNVERFNVVKSDVRFDGLKYEDMKAQNIVLNLNSTINIKIEKGTKRGQVFMKFRK